MFMALDISIDKADEGLLKRSQIRIFFKKRIA